MSGRPECWPATRTLRAASRRAIARSTDSWISVGNLDLRKPGSRSSAPPPTPGNPGTGRDLKANPFAAALFHWLLPVHRQIRVTGAVEEVYDDQSDTYWQSRPPGARRSAAASHQSAVVAGRAVLEQRVAELAEAFPEETGPPRPPRWGGYRIRLEVVELWKEGADGLHDRIRYRMVKVTSLTTSASPLDESRVAHDLNSFDRAEPIGVFVDERSEMTVADGHHRLAAARRLDFTEIKVELRPGTRHDATKHVEFGPRVKHCERFPAEA
jgi:hypothetical protein